MKTTMKNLSSRTKLSLDVADQGLEARGRLALAVHGFGLRQGVQKRALAQAG